ncbi:DUF3231 family protein [Peribacillus deserti]|uniref:Transcriptional regulator n=1 Tax=Peribacillus deserti TaxID=673318 RepID=A0A2N5M3I5_9BACI|nr:DUF3231 family protein [Peribacillus deserti]PLT28885.1 transcriptional regulator [Peribacillus deserti]
MDQVNHQTKLTASELANLWSQFTNDSLSRCIFLCFLNHVKDEEIKDVIQYALELAETHLKKDKQFFLDDNYPIPKGFTDADVTVEAPPLFTDIFMILYVQIMAVHGMTRYAGALGNTMREDQRKYLIECNSETMVLYDRATHVLLTKGIINKPPVLNNHQQVEFVTKQSFLSGWFGKRRPINAVEISGVFLNLQKTTTKIVLELGFSQTAQSYEVRDYFERARQVCQRHFEILSSMLKEDNLHLPRTFGSEVTDATEPCFSDKLMLNHIVTLLSAAIGYYGEAMALCQRRDISAAYARMITEIGILSEDGANLLIEKGWLEQPPTAADHEELSKHK